MSFSLHLPSPAHLKTELPLSQTMKERIARWREEGKDLLKNPQKKVLIVGPCSIHHPKSILSYAEHLKELRNSVKETFFIVMRAYIEKPRTSYGWKGFIYQPDPKKPPNLSLGLFLARKLFLNLIELGIPLCMEFVDPLVAYYFDDLLTWGTIGARTCHSQTHRQIASLLPFPMGFKNPLDGNTEVPLQAMLSASMPHTFFGLSQEGYMSSLSSSGNPWTHAILRGSENATNYDRATLCNLFEEELSYQVSTPIMIDCAHGNSKKNLFLQKEVFIHVFEEHCSYQTPLLGLMLESFLKEGASSSEIDAELSITDPCLSWDDTRNLILWAHDLCSTLLQKGST